VHEPIATPHVLRFGVFEADSRARELRKQGVRVRLQEQPFQLLWLLLERAGEVVTRDELRQKIWPSTVYVDFDHGLNNAVARVRDGYRFVCPVEAVPTALANATVHNATVRRWHRRSWVLGSAVLVLVIGLLVLASISGRLAPEAGTATRPAEPSIAVLPFVNASDQVEREHFAEGLSEELRNKLAGIKGLKVAARTSSLQFGGKQVAAQTIPATLKVNHLLEGSVRHSGSRVRVTTQLVDARNGYNLWSQTYDREFTDIFQVQEDIAMAVAMALQVQLVETYERHLHSRGTRDSEAYRLYLIALTQQRGHGVRDLSRARKLFQDAAARDPSFADAHAGLALSYFRDAWVTLDALEQSAHLGRAAAERAVALDPESSEALIANANFEAWQSRFRGDFQAYARAQQGYRRAIEIAPSSAPAHFNYARAVEWDEPELAQRLFERAAELDPLFSQAQCRATGALHNRGLHDAARKRLQELEAQSLMSGEPVFALYRGMLEVRLGHLDEGLILLPRSTGVEFDLLHWSLYLSLGDREAARQALGTRPDPLAAALREAALLTMDDRVAEALASLEQRRDEFPLSRALDLPVARLALTTGQAQRALPILEALLPDLARGAQPVTARNVMPALDLAAAYASTGRTAAASQLLRRISTFLDGPDVPWPPMFAYLRARAYALSGDREQTLRALDRAYAQGFRKIWAIDLHPQPFHYLDSIDMDPAFSTLRTDPRFVAWRERIAADNARQLEQLRARKRTRPVA
jgi:TolB-like protein